MQNVRRKGGCGQGALDEREVQGAEGLGAARGQRALEAAAARN